MEATRSLYNKAKPFLAVIFLQFGLAGMDILSKVALNRGMSNYVLVVYRHAVATVVIAPFALVFDKYMSIPNPVFSIFFNMIEMLQNYIESFFMEFVKI